MGCERVELPDGIGTAFICSRSKPLGKCACGQRAELLCDFVVAPAAAGRKRRKTCDAKMCRKCAHRLAENRDVCAAHMRLMASADVPPSLFEQPGAFAMQVVADFCEAAMSVTAPSCVPGDAAAAIANLERTLPSGEPGAYAVRTRSDVFDTEAVDFAFECCFKPRDLEDWREFVAERAAIFEYVGGRPRPVAEAMARQLAGPPPRYGQLGPLFAGAR